MTDGFFLCVFVLVQVYRYRLAAVGATFVCQIYTQ